MTGPTSAQHRRMHALLRHAGPLTRDERLRLTAAIVARPLTSSNDLTVAEAARVIDYLDRVAAAGDMPARARAYLNRHTANPKEPSCVS